jgi:nudix-type nucleoside diphosphatase (YffH/AdpP family)
VGAGVRHRMTARIVDIRTVHSGWGTFSIATVETSAGTYTREIEDHGAAAAALPYNPEQRKVMLVRQVRAPILLSENLQDCLETPAGRLDSDAPEVCARREVLEECGLRLHQLEPVARAWSMPGISTEALHLYLAPYSDGDRIADGGGLADENEHLEVLEIACSELAAMMEAGELRDLKTLALAQALRLRHPHLFA